MITTRLFTCEGKIIGRAQAHTNKSVYLQLPVFVTPESLHEIGLAALQMHAAICDEQPFSCHLAPTGADHFAREVKESIATSLEAQARASAPPDERLLHAAAAVRQIEIVLSEEPPRVIPLVEGPAP